LRLIVLFSLPLFGHREQVYLRTKRNLRTVASRTVDID
jgi:hypothetical protein